MMIAGIIVTHGPMASAIIEAASSILGESEKIYAISTSKHSLRSLINKLENLVEEENLHEGVLIMASLKGGSCWNGAVAIARKFPSKVEVVSGVNLNQPVNISLEHFSREIRTQIEQLTDREVSKIITEAIIELFKHLQGFGLTYQAKRENRFHWRFVK